MQPEPQPSSRVHARTRGGTLAVVTGQITVQSGAAFAILLFPLVGPIGTVSLRLAISTVLLYIVLRPKLRGLSKEAWVTAILFGVVLCGMNTSLYLSISYMPLGPAVTIEMLGPLLLTVILARKLSSWVWAAIAFAGVALLGLTGETGFHPLGVTFALVAALFWALNIIVSWRTARLFRGADGLVIALGVATVIMLPAGILTQGADLFTPSVLWLAVIVAVLSSALPYALEQVALRRLEASQFAMLMSLSPAVAALMGFLVHGDQLSVLEITGILLVVVATAGAMRPQSTAG